MSAKLRSRHDSNKEKATKLTPTRVMAPLTCELWQVWCSLTFSNWWTLDGKGSKKNSCHSFSLWSAGTGEEIPFKSHRLITHKQQGGIDNSFLVSIVTHVEFCTYTGSSNSAWRMKWSFVNCLTVSSTRVQFCPKDCQNIARQENCYFPSRTEEET